MKNYRPIVLSFFTSIFLLCTLYFVLGTALAADFEIIPKATEDVGTTVKNIGVGWEVRDKYDEQAKTYQEQKNVWEAFASGVFTRSLILDYVVYVVQFLSQIWLLIGALMIIYAGYIYASSIFTGKEAGAGNKAITNAIIWVLVIIFSYAIMKLITSAFIS